MRRPIQSSDFFEGLARNQTHRAWDVANIATRAGAQAGECSPQLNVDRRTAVGGMALAFVASLFPVGRLYAKPSPKLHEVADGVFVFVGEHALQSAENLGHICNCAVVVGGTSVAVIDTGGSAQVGTILLEAIRGVTDKPIRYVINTHMHPDHVFGNAAFQSENVTFVGHYKLPRALLSRGEHYLASNAEMMGKEALAGTEIIPPSLLVKTELTLDLGGRELICTSLPTAHTDNDLHVLDRKTGALMTGDIVFNEHIPTLDGSILGWLKVLEQLERDPPKLIVPGHGPASVSPGNSLPPIRRYLGAVAQDCRDAIAQGATMTDAIKSAGQSEKGRWQMFDQYHARNVSAAFAELEWE